MQVTRLISVPYHSSFEPQLMRTMVWGTLCHIAQIDVISHTSMSALFPKYTSIHVSSRCDTESLEHWSQWWYPMSPLVKSVSTIAVQAKGIQVPMFVRWVSCSSYINVGWTRCKSQSGESGAVTKAFVKVNCTETPAQNPDIHFSIFTGLGWLMKQNMYSLSIDHIYGIIQTDPTQVWKSWCLSLTSWTWVNIRFSILLVPGGVYYGGCLS